MGRISIGEKLRQNFSSADKKSWTEIAKTEVNGNEPFIFLAHEDGDKINFFPYYEKSDLASFIHSQSFVLPPSRQPFQAPRAWSNMPAVKVNDAASANAVALEHLSLGADGVVFDFDVEAVDARKLLADIKAEYCVLGFKGRLSADLVYEIERQLHLAPSAESINGFIFWDDLPKLRSNGTGSRFKRFTNVISPSTPVKEIANALVNGVSTFDGSGKSAVDFAQIAFSLTINDTFLHEVAKLKALRMLWYQIAKAYGFDDYEYDSLQIHANVRTRTDDYDPHGNMLHSTNAAMAAVIGGCNALTIEPADHKHATLNRIARNVSNILREESHLDKVSDPLAGAYAIQAITHALCEKAWMEFQTRIK